jgi:hypothetical protein
MDYQKLNGEEAIVYDETAVKNAFQDIWLDYFNHLAERHTAQLKFETDMRERWETLSDRMTELSGHVYKLLVRVTAIEGAVPPSTEEMKTITECRDFLKDFPRVFHGMSTGNAAGDPRKRLDIARKIVTAKMRTLALHPADAAMFRRGEKPG